MKKAKITKKIEKIIRLVMQINAKGENLVVKLSSTTLNIFDGNDGCKSIECGLFGGYVWLDFGGTSAELDIFISYLQNRLIQNEVSELINKGDE